MKKSEFSFLLAFIFFISCGVENIPISVQPADSEIAVSSLVGPEETFFIALSKSFSALSADDVNDLSEDLIDRLLLDSALVVLSYEGITDTLQNVFDVKGLFGGQLQSFNDFQTLELTVFDSTSSQTIQSSSMLLPQAEIDTIMITKRDQSDNNIVQLLYKIIDRPEENFYVVQAYQFSEEDSTQNDLFFGSQGFLIYENLVTDLGAEDGIITKEESIEFTSDVDSALVVVTNISEGYYRFLEARQRSGGVISSLANEPVNHPSNIENGVGYFSAHRPKVVIVAIESINE